MLGVHEYRRGFDRSISGSVLCMLYSPYIGSNYRLSQRKWFDSSFHTYLYIYKFVWPNHEPILLFVGFNYFFLRQVKFSNNNMRLPWTICDLFLLHIHISLSFYLSPNFDPSDLYFQMFHLRFFFFNLCKRNHLIINPKFVDSF